MYRTTDETQPRTTRSVRQSHRVKLSPNNTDLLYNGNYRSDRPRSKLAAVLVLLYEQAGELRVLLTTRSKALRTHAGQTALPGGKVDDEDESFVETAVSP
jgi:hypothetical protein